MVPSDADSSAWFAGPKGENAEWFAALLSQVTWDYYFWRRNYYPEDGVVVGAEYRRHQDGFRDRFEDRLNELLGRLKADCPFYSPRYAGHMISEQTLPSIAAYFAAMLYNPNNVAYEAAPVTVDLELEAATLVSRMLGHGGRAWAHLASGGTMANFEALWTARNVQYLPFALAAARQRLGLPAAVARLGQSARKTLEDFASLYQSHDIRSDLSSSPTNVADRGVAAVERELGSTGVVLVPETHHYCFSKAMDLLGLGRDNLVRVCVDDQFRMVVADLADKLDEVENSGRHVLMVVAVVGTTEEGAVDPVDQIVALREQREVSGRPSFWLHADAAYGGYLRTVVVPERIGLGEPMSEVRFGDSPCKIDLQLPVGDACDALAALGECDSVTVDPHKLGYVPYPAGLVSFRDRAVKPLARQAAPYIDEDSVSLLDDEVSDQIGMFTLEGSKPGAAAASVWLSHKVIPLDTSGLGVVVRESIRNACELYELLRRFPDESPGQTAQAVTLCPPGSNIVCYAFRPAESASLRDINELSQALYKRFSLARDGKHSVYEQGFFVSRTTLDPHRYSIAAVTPFLDRLGVTAEEFQREGVFLLRSVLMNPWYGAAKERGRYFLSDLVQELYGEAGRLLVKP
ncbi:MAG: hypothetical protein JSS65_13795 [Armatimonadetes bacterium]|nr:hypothetical protein [Armatimonadota bacterium]